MKAERFLELGGHLQGHLAVTALDVANVAVGDAQPLGEFGLGEVEIGAEGDKVHALFSHTVRKAATPISRNTVKAVSGAMSQTARVAKKTTKQAANHLRAWREYRGLTQAELADLVGTADNVISLLESGDRGLSDKWLRKLAPVLRTRPGFLLEFDPHDANLEIVEAVVEIAPENRRQALDILKTFKTGTSDR